MNLSHRHTPALARRRSADLFAVACGSDESDGTESGTGSDVGLSSATATGQRYKRTRGAPASVESTTTTTVAPTTTRLSLRRRPRCCSMFTGDEADVAAARAVVFDSSADFEDKVLHLVDAESWHRPSTPPPPATASAVSALFDGGHHRWWRSHRTYDVIFGGNPAYSISAPSISSTARVVPRSEFCSFMASARAGCENDRRC